MVPMEYGDVPKWLKGPDSKSGRRVLPVQEFESLHLRHNATVILIELRWHFSMPENRLIQGFSDLSAYKRTPRQAILRRGFVRFMGIAAFCSAVIVKQPSNR